MTWIYSQASGSLVRDGEVCGHGYSGKADCKNVPAAQDRHRSGPIPRGIYKLQPAKDSETHGRFCIPLAPSLDNQMFGRNGFMIHGDSLTHPGTASEGCIILPLEVRMRMMSSGDHDMEVV